MRTRHTGKNCKRGLVASRARVPTPTPKDSLEIIFRPDPNIYDGRWNNVGWLQELPKPVTNLSWDNAAIVSGATLSKWGFEEDDIVEITVGNGRVKAPIIVAPGHPDNSVTVYLGYGREVPAAWARGQGFNAYLIRNTWAPLYATGSIRKIEGKWGIAITKSHYQDHRGATSASRARATTRSKPMRRSGPRGIIRYATLDEFKANPNFAHEGEGHETPTRDTSLFPNWEYNEANAWAMSIDMNSCTGCNACIVSCYAENNIAVVGKQQVRIGRNMQWLRIDTYFEGDLSAPRAHFQPMTCQHCENAPCEQVCPVGATVHTPEGLNMMVYNRCVGTRYCSNNCPYKVRRFNFLLLLRLRNRKPEADAQSRRERALARRDGEVQLLRAAHLGSQDRGRQGKSQYSRRRNRDRVPAGVPGRGDRLRQHERSKTAGYRNCARSSAATR